VTPLTWQGQIVIICYATFGIPLFLMTTAKISVMLSNIFAFLFKHIILFPFNLFCNFNDSSKRKNSKSKKVKKLVWNQDEDEDEDDDEHDDETYAIEEAKNPKVPLIIILCKSILITAIKNQEIYKKI
jgi:hypothetical protein